MKSQPKGTTQTPVGKLGNRIKDLVDQGENGKPKKERPVTEVIELPPLKIQHLTVTVVGDSGMICHRFDEKSIQQIKDKQSGKASQKKGARDPWAEFVNSLYWLSKRPKKVKAADLRKGKFGFPALAFKRAAVDACTHVDGVAKTEARGAFHVEGEFVEIAGTKPEYREDMRRIGMNIADPVYRGYFPEGWRATLHVRYNANMLTAGQIVNLFNTAGFAVGIGDWRPQKNGNYGMFHVAAQGER